MKNLILFILLLLSISFIANSQNSGMESSSFKQTQQSFYQNFQGQAADISESGDFNQFKRWERFWGPRLMPHNSFDAIIKKQQQYLATYDPKNRLSEKVKSNWTELGPNTNDIGML